VTLSAWESVDVPFDLPLPRTLPPGNELLVSVTNDDEVLVADPVTVPPRFESTLDLPRELIEGETYLAHLRLANNSPQSPHDIQIALTGPFAVRIGQSRQSLDRLGPNESVELHWRLTAIADLRERAVEATVATADGGGQRLDRTGTIQPARERLDAPPPSPHAEQHNTIQWRGSQDYAYTRSRGERSTHMLFVPSLRTTTRHGARMHQTPLGWAGELKTLQGLSLNAFGQSYRLELMLAIAARFDDGLVTLTDLAQELHLGLSKIQGALSSLVALGLLTEMPSENARCRFLLRDPSTAWQWADELAPAARADAEVKWSWRARTVAERQRLRTCHRR
jgi:hypothetical protein